MSNFTALFQGLTAILRLRQRLLNCTHAAARFAFLFEYMPIDVKFGQD